MNYFLRLFKKYLLDFLGVVNTVDVLSSHCTFNLFILFQKLLKLRTLKFIINLWKYLQRFFCQINSKLENKWKLIFIFIFIAEFVLTIKFWNTFFSRFLIDLSKLNYVAKRIMYPFPNYISSKYSKISNFFLQLSKIRKWLDFL